jgi:uncharacterized protein YdcH (DUF465 family)
MKEKELKELLLERNDKFRKAYKEHLQLDKKLEKLGKKSFLTEAEKMDEKEMKKRKLVLKDKMYYLMTEYRKIQK